MGFYLLHLHLHGLFRGHDLELGRDADTGGQTTYVLELVRTLAARPEVDRVEVVTRLIDDRRVSSDYARPVEAIAPGATLLRFPCGPKRYLRKELLWPHLDELADALVAHLTAQVRRPDWIHAHYADAGHVGVLVSQRLGIPLVFTGHSLGREKLRRLLQSGGDHEQIEQQYAISRRIEAEERALAHSRLVVTSTRQEAARQYARYAHFRPERAEVIPPGVDVHRFHPGTDPSPAADAGVSGLVEPFLRDPGRPPLLAICRADRRKNVFALVEAFARSDLLRQRHNLLLVLGCRHDSHHLDRHQRDLFQQLFELIDRFDLYGRIAYPKSHTAEQVPALYRWAARRRGVFVNPALTEPFGLTLLEAAASGLPVVATDDGGPQEIVARCRNGLLVDVTDLDGLQEALETAGSDPDRWRRWREAGIEGVSRHFSWDAHVAAYLGHSSRRCRPSDGLPAPLGSLPQERSSLGERLLLLDLDRSLGRPDQASLQLLRQRLERDATSGIGILSGRGFKAARHRFLDLLLPEPRVWITGAGSEIRIGPEGALDPLWQQWIAADWRREAVCAALEELGSRLCLQAAHDQGPFKVSYLLQEPAAGLLPMVRQKLLHHRLAARAHLFEQRCLDVLPLRASKAEALRHLALRWRIPLERILVVAAQQGDGDLLTGLQLGVVTADHDPELEGLRQQRRVFFASRPQAWGVLEGLDHYRFLHR